MRENKVGTHLSILSGLGFFVPPMSKKNSTFL